MVFKKINNRSGFTLIEIIMVIVILGILAAIIVPKFLDFAEEAEENVESTFIGRLKSVVHSFGSDRLIFTGNRYFPKVQSPLFDRVLNEVPDNWTYTESDGKIEHTRSDGQVETWYYWTNSDSTEFDIKDNFEPSGGTNQITICHYPPGNPDNPQTITISQSAWPAHQAHGDVLGSCN